MTYEELYDRLIEAGLMPKEAASLAHDILIGDAAKSVMNIIYPECENEVPSFTPWWKINTTQKFSNIRTTTDTYGVSGLKLTGWNGISFNNEDIKSENE